MTTTLTKQSLLGRPIDRIDGRRKVAGAAPYPSDFDLPGQAHAALVSSTIANGRITRIDRSAAEAAPGVLLVLTRDNAPAVADPPMSNLGSTMRWYFRDDRILHYGQHIGIVVAGTRAQAQAAARLVEVEYAAEEPVLDLDDPRATIEENPYGLDSSRGDAAAALDAADVTVDSTYTIGAEINSPMGLFTTVASWQGGRLVVHDTTQFPSMVRASLAAMFGVPERDVRVLIPFLGGGFGAGLRLWSHTVLTTMAARELDRPVKLVLTRPQMFSSTGHRAASRQRMRLGATQDGRLVAIDHDAVAANGIGDMLPAPIEMGTPMAYACDNVATHERRAHLNIAFTGFMRAPGSVELHFALESALDELAGKLGIDPVELRLRNYAEVHPESGKPWSSKALRECLTVGADRFGWSGRDPSPRSTRDGDLLVGQGMAEASFDFYAQPCTVRLSVDRGGNALVRTGATDIGTGTYTITAQLTADLLGIEVDQVRVELGDTDLPPAPQSGGSGLAGALGAAVKDAAAALGERLARLDGRPGETIASLLDRHGLDELSATGHSDLPAAAATTDLAVAGPFAATFAEVGVDEELGVVRVRRLVSVIDGGRLYNEKTARSQIIGGTVMGIGAALLEEAAYDPHTGRVANGTFGDYLMAVNADVPDLDITFVGGPDAFNPVGTKGLGEIGIVAVAPAIANAVHHATGRRIRDLPITLDKLL
ncbi:xanthine dehydrogenase family protein molybdopterin-binding subunit [Asanoa iriomotensis]|uniref:Carbon-monoxide dehydrogenase large subunit n=1 Tax=Asanoa iriomotensis TaxID=234613 RepID=A0ABQ4C796_9ACTN|nr:xanthine dehydrogenase family protein molybdopterin-binding subunit [Asanoa iriomotensis]GIF58640.1 carbon-monoxide dehydrogenase large subunit [Asanoa iriomotensis]